eukprot:gnl/TRDRNA2_/TRDRNA2_177327_c3_seq1.p1 gnl/TRDRNA2_/TRDRNA2_177327_c3~~gnl/TRDRNA2_/TRDRNA2_177327_c3_seq1.p1  ORF type:complete len:696 (-),score=266.13 gnl/TRDRNA2_/TRDRNA2_177327_c3_seq1:102-2189(-)
MKLAVIGCFALLLASGSDAAGVTPVQKVIQMMTAMKDKSLAEKQADEIAFAKEKMFCEMTSEEKQTAIADANEQIKVLTADIEGYTAEAARLAKEIKKHEEDIAVWTGDTKAAKGVRALEKSTYDKTHKDYTESIDALERAIDTIKKGAKDKAQLVQIAGLPEQAKHLMVSFLQLEQDPLDTQPPEADAFQSSSGPIIAMLNKMLDGFVEQRTTLEKEEMNSVHAYNMVVMDLTDTIENTNKEIQSKVELKEAKQTKAGEDKKQLASTISTKKEDESTLSNMDTECKEKTLSFDEKNQLRAEEIEALNKAIEILSADDVSGNAAKHLALLQATSFAQMRGTNSGTDYLSAEGIHRRLREFLAKEGKRLKSQRLSLLADKLLANPFGKVKKLIDDMITRLLEEANEDASHEGFCDKEMGESKITRNKLNEEIDALQAAVEDGKATIMTLTNEIADLEKEMSDLSAAMTEATSMRTAEKKKNAATIKDAQAAQNAVTAATAVLKDFYTKAAKATGFIQTAADQTRPKMGTDEWKALANPNFKGTVDSGHKAGMQTFGKKFTGQQDSASGVLAMLEVIASDFENLISDTEAAESAGKTGFDNFMTESKKAVKMKNKKIELDGSDKTDAEAKLREDVADLKNTQDELLAAERYYDKLVPQCIDKGMTFEERTAAREAEIASLKEALEILGSQGSIETSA